MDHIPNEILSHIFSHLLTDREKQRLHQDRIDCILPVRLQSKKTVVDGFRSWKKLLRTESINAVVRRVAIETTPWDPELGEGGDLEWWPDSWIDHGVWHEFDFAIILICNIPNLNSLTVRFSTLCAGEENDGLEPEPTHVRERTLRIIERALRMRETLRKTSIRELVLFGFEDTPLPKDLTQNLLRNIERLHISFTYGDHQREKPEFPPYLANTLLPSVSEHLVELTLAGYFWGSITVEFNGKGLSFPCLKSLTLEEYIILRQDQYDWVLEQRSLIDLKLYDCKIATHFLVGRLENWGVNLNGWEKLTENFTDVDGSYHSSISSTSPSGPLQLGWYTSDLRWSSMFDRIHENLPMLQNFTFGSASWQNYFEHLPKDTNKDVLPSERYQTFYHGYWSDDWYKPVNKRSPWVEAGYFENDTVPGTPLGLYLRTELPDRRALEKLMEVTRKRRDGK
ncbi:hypothetical protein FPHYL_4542 [Fusarium phyllophilum]|uniref:F-box domain-containing protein n=1 Tax=Fusarium phyllophilum TaxID=47803 RepID=A0A8H5K377_9HYPO|nr:hypothetical protein FPHYL_4542 [Fusarium phyllophilum]